jgi:RNA polymerase sigma factor (sigma-70 family)
MLPDDESRTEMSLTDPEIREFVRGLAASERDEVLARRVLDYIVRLSSSLAHTTSGLPPGFEAEDAAAAAVIALYGYADDPIPHPRALIAKIVRSIVRRVIRRDDIYARAEADSCFLTGMDLVNLGLCPHDQAAKDEELRRLERSIEELGADLRAAIRLHFLEGRSYRDAGEELGMTHAGFGKRVNLALAALRRAFKIPDDSGCQKDGSGL